MNPAPVRYSTVSEQNRELAQNDPWRPQMAQDVRGLRAGHARAPQTPAQIALLRRNYPAPMTLPSDGRPPSPGLQNTLSIPRQWAPAMNRHAIVPVSTICFQWWIRAVMKQVIPQMKLADSGSQFAGLIAKYSFDSFAAESVRICNDPFIRQWQEATFEQFLRNAEQATIADARVWSIQSHRAQRAAAISAQGLRETGEATKFLYDLVSNGAAIVSTVSSTTLPVSFLSLTSVGGPLLGLAVLGLAQKYWQTGLNEKEHRAEMKLRSLQGGLNDNLQIGNSYNERLWREELAIARKEHTSAWRRRAAIQALTDVALTSVNTFCIIHDQAYDVSTRSFNPHDGTGKQQIDEIIENVRNTNEISHRVTELVKDISSYQKHSTHLQSLQDTVSSVPHDEWEKRSAEMLSRIHQIHIDGPIPFVTAQQLVQDPRMFLGQAGRWVIRAENGTGKSVLLNVLVQAMGNDAHYLPVKHDLQHRWRGGSAGENIIEHVAELVEGAESSTIFLDEWPANLSRHNEQRLDAILDQLATHRCIVEVRH